jgi:PIN domain-containing protein
VRRLVPDLTDAWLFHSRPQAKHLASFAALGTRHTSVPLSRPGRNALDFHLAFYLGYIAARDPEAKFVVIAIDNNYAPMIEHAKHLGFKVEKMAFKAGILTQQRRKVTLQLLEFFGMPIANLP